MSEVVHYPVLDALGRRRVLAAVRHDTACGVVRGNCRGVRWGDENAKSVRGSLLPLSVSGTRVPDAE